MNDQKDLGPEEGVKADAARSSGLALLVFVFALPLALVLLAEWLVF